MQSVQQRSSARRFLEGIVGLCREETSLPLLLSALIGMPHHYIRVGDDAMGRCWADPQDNITLKEYKKRARL